MSLSQFINEAEYRIILEKVNQVICEFSKSADKTQEAGQFLAKVAEKCKSRDEFLKLVEQRLDLISNPNKGKEAIDWFIGRRSALVEFLKSMTEKAARDPTFLSKFSPSFAKGLKRLEYLLSLDDKSITSNLAMDLLAVKKMVVEMKTLTESKNKAVKAEKLARVDQTMLYDKLHDLLVCINLAVLTQAGPEESKLIGTGGAVAHVTWSVTEIAPPCSADQITRHQKALQSYTTTLKEVLDKESVYRLECAMALVESYLANRRPVSTDAGTSAATTASAGEEADGSDDGSEAAADNGATSTQRQPTLPDTIIYAALCELKAAEWAHLQELRTFNRTHPAADATVSAENERIALAGKKRKAQVALDGVVIPSAAQKVLDSLQQQGVNAEAGSHQGRAEHCAAQARAAEEALQAAPWERVVDVSVYAGSASRR